MRAMIQRDTTSGMLVFNDCLMQAANEDLPFGGVGRSGMGAYHGKLSFDTFSHKRSVLFKTSFLDVWARYPPYNGVKRFVLNILLLPSPSWLVARTQTTLGMALGLVLALVFRREILTGVVALCSALLEWI